MEENIKKVEENLNKISEINETVDNMIYFREIVKKLESEAK